MSDDGKRPYVERVREGTRRYVRELLGENLRLREDAGRVTTERDALRREVEALREERRRHDEEHGRLLATLGTTTSESRRFEERFLELEQQSANLAALYTASYQLHATLRRAEVLLAIQEIVINLVGSEELAVLSLTGGAPAPLVAVGVERAPEITPGGAISRALETRAPVIADGDPDGVTACVPLLVGGRLVGAIVIFRLLPQKGALGPFDQELLELLATHAATALYCAELHERDAGDRP